MSITEVYFAISREIDAPREQVFRACGSAPAYEAEAAEARWRAVLDRLADQVAGSHSRGNAGGIRPG